MLQLLAFLGQVNVAEPDHLGIIIGTVLSTLGVGGTLIFIIWKLFKPLQKAVLAFTVLLESKTDDTGAPVPSKLEATVASTVQVTQSPLLDGFREAVEAIKTLARSNDAVRQTYETNDTFQRDILTRLQEEFTAFRGKVATDTTTFENRISELEIDNQTKTQRITELEGEITALKDRVAAFVAREAKMEQERDQAMIELAKAQANLATQLKRADGLQVQHDADLIQIGELTADRDRLRAANEQLTADNLALRQLLDGKQQTITHELGKAGIADTPPDDPGAPKTSAAG